MSQETKVGLFTMVAVAAILSGIIFLGDVHIFERRHRYSVDFANVEALPPKASVKISGVEVGKVLKVALVDGRARVLIAIDPDIEVFQNATARIASTGIIGTRFVDLNPGNPKTGEMAKGTVIPGVGSAGMEQMFSKISSLFDDDPKYGNAIDNLKATIANFRHISDSLDGAVGGRAEDLSLIVSNIKELSESAKNFSKDLSDITSTRKEDVKIALANFRDISEKLNAIMTKIEKGEGTIGALVSDKKTEEDVKAAVSSIKDTAAQASDILGRVTRINTYWNFRYRYDTRASEGKTDMGLTFVPKPGKYYSIGVTNLGEVPPDEKHTQYERKNRFTATLGGDYGPFTGYAGAIRSRGGVGLNFRPLWKSRNLGRRVELQSEMSDFSRDDVVNGEAINKPYLALGAHVALAKWLWVGVREEDILSHSSFQVYTNIVLLDRDLAYLLGLGALSRP